jgi:hypothetical protein
MPGKRSQTLYLKKKIQDTPILGKRSQTLYLKNNSRYPNTWKKIPVTLPEEESQISQYLEKDPRYSTR